MKRQILASSHQSESVAPIDHLWKTGDTFMDHDVFISHCTGDKAVANAVCHAMESHGVRCWIAPRDVTPGMPYAECLVKAIAGAEVFVLVFSEGVNTSQHVMREVERAVSKEVPIIPFRIEDATPKNSMEFFLSSPHWLDAITPPMEQHLKALVEVAQALMKRVPGDPIPDGEGGDAQTTSEPARRRFDRRKSMRMESPSFRSILAPKSPAWLTGIVAAISTIVLYGAVFRQLEQADVINVDAFTQRGPMPCVMTFLFTWAIVSLLINHRIFRKFSRRATLDVLFAIAKTASHGEPQHTHISSLPVLGTDPITQSLVAKVRSTLEGAQRPILEQSIASEEKADLLAIREKFSSITLSIWFVLGFGIIGSLIGGYEAFRALSTLATTSGGDMEVLRDSFRAVIGGAYSAFESTLIGIAMAGIIGFLSYLFRTNELQQCKKIYDAIRQVIISVFDDLR